MSACFPVPHPNSDIWLNCASICGPHLIFFFFLHYAIVLHQLVLEPQYHHITKLSEEGLLEMIGGYSQGCEDGAGRWAFSRHKKGEKCNSCILQ